MQLDKDRHVFEQSLITSEAVLIDLSRRCVHIYTSTGIVAGNDIELGGSTRTSDWFLQRTEW